MNNPFATSVFNRLLQASWLFSVVRALSMLLVCLFVLVFALDVHPAAAASASGTPGAYTVFLPMVIRQEASVVVQGIYPADYWQPNPTSIVQNEFKALETWSGQKMSLAGVFHQFASTNPPVLSVLTPLWDGGFTPFVNIYAAANATQIANGELDAYIRPWAQQFKTYANNGQRMAYLAPLQEMNWGDLPYSRNPAEFKRAYAHIQGIFTQEGVPAASVRWVFAVNNGERAGDPGFEAYYPGDQAIDVIAVSGYNFGYSPYVSSNRWQSPQQVFETALGRLNAMAPSKPIFIAQMGTTAYTQRGVTNEAAKNQWLQDAYTSLPQYTNVRGILYVNAAWDVDWLIFKSGTGSQPLVGFWGYADGIASGAYRYVSPTQLMTMSLLK